MPFLPFRLFYPNFGTSVQKMYAILSNGIVNNTPSPFFELDRSLNNGSIRELHAWNKNFTIFSPDLKY